MIKYRPDILLRAGVALGLALAILVLAATISRAEPGCNYNADGSCAGSASTSRSVALGQGRPAGCPRAWCGCWARLQVALPPRYNLALAWLDLPRTSKSIGAWAVMRRKGGGHVGRVVDVDASGNPVLESGNHGGVVGTATYPAGRIVAYVRP